MKVKAVVLKVFEMEVDDKFAVLDVKNPEHISYPENSELCEELDNLVLSEAKNNTNIPFEMGQVSLAEDYRRALLMA
jgi:hypothetical protein